MRRVGQRAGSTTSDDTTGKAQGRIKKGSVIPGFGLVIMLACAGFFYKAGEEEYSSGLLLAVVSVALWLAGAYWLGLGLIASFLVQLGFFAALTIWNVVRDKPKK